MRKIVASWIINAISFFAVSRVLHGFRFDNVWSLLLAGILLGIVNATFKPLLVIVSFPFTVATLGLFFLIINALVIETVALFDPGFSVSSFWDALVGAILLSLISSLINYILFPRKEANVV